MLRSGRGRGPAPRFDRTGFPMDPKDRVARRDRLRARVVTTTVVATVVAAPVLALWAAYRGGPDTGEPAVGDATRISSSESELPTARTDGRPLTAYENAGNAATTSGTGFAQSDTTSDVSVEVISSGPPATPDQAGDPGRLTVAASAQGAVTLLTLTATGSAPVDWRLWSDAPGCARAGPRARSPQENRSPYGSPWTPRASPSAPGGPGSGSTRAARWSPSRAAAAPRRRPRPPPTRRSPRRRRPRRTRHSRPPRPRRSRRSRRRPRRPRRPRRRAQAERFPPPRTRPRRGHPDPDRACGQAGSAGCGAIGSSEASRASHSFTSSS